MPYEEVGQSPIGLMLFFIVFLCLCLVGSFLLFHDEKKEKERLEKRLSLMNEWLREASAFSCECEVCKALKELELKIPEK